MILLLNDDGTPFGGSFPPEYRYDRLVTSFLVWRYHPLMPQREHHEQVDADIAFEVWRRTGIGAEHWSKLSVVDRLPWLEHVVGLLHAEAEARGDQVEEVDAGEEVPPSESPTGAAAARLNPTDRKIIRELEKAKMPLLGKVVANRVGASPDYTRQRLGRLLKEEVICHGPDGYSLPAL